jgi:seryl-tRNA synthetase
MKNKQRFLNELDHRCLGKSPKKETLIEKESESFAEKLSDISKKIGMIRQNTDEMVSKMNDIADSINRFKEAYKKVGDDTDGILHIEPGEIEEDQDRTKGNAETDGQSE